MSPPINIDGSQVSGVTIDGTDVSEVTVDGTTVFRGIPDSGIARLQFEQNVEDSWNNNDGVDNTGVGYTTDSAEGTYAKSFDGSGAVEIPSFPNHDANFSLRFIVNSSGSGDTMFWQTGQNGSSNAFSNGIGIFNSGSDFGIVPYDWTSGDNVVVVASNSDIRTGAYEEVVITSSGSPDNADVTGYINGSQTGAESGVKTFSVTDAYRAYIGEREDGANSLSGSLDDLRFYNKELTSTEVQNLYDTGSISG